ncbi:MAG: alpha/beta fold hydrolase [Terriglobales bacterium]
MRKFLLLALLALAPLRASAQAPPKSAFFITSDGVRLHYLEAGSGPTMVFLPGWTMPGWIWGRQLAQFSQRYHVIAVDPRSQGASAKPPDGNYPERRARDYRELLQHLKVARAVLVGWSMAVPELMAYVDQFGTSEIRGLVLVDGMVITDESFLKIVPAWLRSMEMDRRGFTERFVKSMYKKQQPPRYLKRVIAASLLTPTSNAVALVIGSVGRPDWSPVLAKLAGTPVLFIGEDFMKKQALAIAEKLPSLKTEIFEDAGHAIFVDDAQRFNTVLEKFVASIGGK